MNEINENIVKIVFKDFLKNDAAWGRDQGRQVYRLLEDEIFRIDKTYPGKRVVIIDLAGLTKVDASFPQEAIVEIFRKFRHAKYFVLINIDNQVVEENLSIAFEKKNEIGLVNDNNGFRTIGSPLAKDLMDIIRMAATKGSITSKDVQTHFKLSIQNASNKLKLLWEMGLLQKTEGSAPSGGKENVYRVGW